MPTNFWKYYIHYEPIMRKILVASTKAGTMMNELVIDEFLKSSVLVPSIEEQTRIGSILKNIDNLITLHQRKFYIYGMSNFHMRRLSQFNHIIFYARYCFWWS